MFLESPWVCGIDHAIRVREAVSLSRWSLSPATPPVAGEDLVIEVCVAGYHDTVIGQVDPHLAARGVRIHLTGTI